MEMPKPTEVHRKLEVMAGDWVGEEKLHPSPWDPAGGPAVGRVHNRLALDGFALIQDYEQERNGKVTFRGHGVLTWNPQENCYVMYWVDSMGSTGNQFKGSFDGGVLSMICMDAPMQSRSVWDFKEKDRNIFRMDVSQDGKQWHTFLEGAYKRQR